MKRKVLFLDRDGTINKDVHYLNDPEKVEYLPHLFDTLKNLSQLGFDFVVVTNQSGIPRGFITTQQLESIHQKIKEDFAREGLNVLGFYHSPHLPDSNHPTRKPNPGMLLSAVQEFKINLEQSWMIGDNASDILAGENAGCKTILIKQPSTKPLPVDLKPDFTAQNWVEIESFIKKHKDKF